jgi:hypothetical protein
MSEKQGDMSTFWSNPNGSNAGYPSKRVRLPFSTHVLGLSVSKHTAWNSIAAKSTVQWTSEQPFGSLKCRKAAWYAHSPVNFRTAVRRSEVSKGWMVCREKRCDKCFRENRCAKRKSNSLPYIPTCYISRNSWTKTVALHVYSLTCLSKKNYRVLPTQTHLFTKDSILTKLSKLLAAETFILRNVHSAVHVLYYRHLHVGSESFIKHKKSIPAGHLSVLQY